MRVAEYDTLECPEEAERSGKGWTLESSESISALLLISDAWADRPSEPREENCRDCTHFAPQCQELCKY